MFQYELSGWAAAYVAMAYEKDLFHAAQLLSLTYYKQKIKQRNEKVNNESKIIDKKHKETRKRKRENVKINKKQ